MFAAVVPKEVHVKRILIVLLVVLLLAACRPTPEAETVHQKGVETERQWMVESEPKAYRFPNEWVHTEQLRNDLSVEIDASIVCPDTDLFPVYAVEPCAFPKDKLDSVQAALFPNATHVLRSDGQTRDGIKATMEELLFAIANVDLNHPEFSASEKEQYLHEMDEALGELREQYADAPETVSDKQIDSLSSCVHGDGWTATVSVVDPDSKQELGTVEFNSSPSGQTTDDTVMKLIASLYSPWNDAGRPVDLTSEAEITALSQRFLEAVGLASEYAVNAIHQEESLPGGVIADCTRQYETVAVTFVPYAGSAENASQEDRYAPFWDQEVVSLIVFPEGVAFMIWNCPSRLVSAENKNAQLLSFVDIQEQALASLKVSQRPNDSAVGRRLIITKIRLGYCVVRRAEGGYSAIPVWDFFGYWYDRYASQSDTQWLLDENMEHKWYVYEDSACLLTLNAIDGSVIDRSRGY